MQQPISREAAAQELRQLAHQADEYAKVRDLVTLTKIWTDIGRVAGMYLEAQAMRRLWKRAQTPHGVQTTGDAARAMARMILRGGELSH